MSDANYDAPADAWPKKGCSGKGTECGYTVEARYAYHEPLHIQKGLTLDLRWKAITFPAGHPGVPTRPRWSFALASTHLMTYEAAQALRWWFIADIRVSDLGGYCLQTRLVKHKIEYSYSEEAVSADEEIGYAGRPLTKKETP